MNQEGALGAARKLADSLEKVRARSVDAARFCTIPDAKKNRQRLVQAVRAMQRYINRLSTRAVRRSLDPALRQTLLAEGKAIGGDLKILRTRARCPDDALLE